MDDDGTPLWRLKNHKHFRPAIEAILTHPFKDDLKSLHGAVIVRGGKNLSVGINKPQRNVFVDMNSIHDETTQHAEVSSLLQIRNKIDLTGCKIYVVRITKDGILSLSKPCISCSRVLAKYGIKKVYFSTDNGFETMNRRELLAYAA